MLTCPGCIARQKLMEQLGRLVDAERRRREEAERLRRVQLEGLLQEARQPCRCQPEASINSDFALTSG